MTILRKASRAAAILMLAGSVSAAGTLSATAATSACGSRCISIFSKELGNYKQLGVVEDVLGGAATVGQAVILTQASGSDTSQDLIPTGGRIVSDFFKSGMVSAEVNSRYGSLKAAQIEYAPGGKPTGLCSAVTQPLFENEQLTLQPCNVPGTTVWIIDTADSPSTAAAGYFPLVNAATTDFARPFAMSVSQAEVASNRVVHIYLTQLQFGSDKSLPDGQLWGAHFGIITP
jgi:PPE-repeat protein